MTTIFAIWIFVAALINCPPGETITETETEIVSTTCKLDYGLTAIVIVILIISIYQIIFFINKIYKKN